MDKYLFSAERNVQIVISLLKQHGIKRVIASPGTTNITLVHSLQNDPWFEIYSSVDERSAAYIACGMARESGEPVVLTCTGATASRNYAPGLTEAFYSKIPILAITSTQPLCNIGHLRAQCIDRTQQFNDIVNVSVQVQSIKDAQDEWDVTVKVNKAILELKRNGGGPAHINLATTYSRDYSVSEIKPARKIERITSSDLFPELPKGKIAICAGPKFYWSDKVTLAIDRFCERNDAVVFCDHTCNYKGKYRMLFNLVDSQRFASFETLKASLLIHIGEIAGEICTPKAPMTWRVSEDGEIRDTFKNLKYVFQMSEQAFFEHYSNSENGCNTYFDACLQVYNDIYRKLPMDQLPFTNIWAAYTLAPQLPHGSVLHLGILNSLRSWDMFEVSNDIKTYSNTGGYGIDGSLSAVLGASQVHSDKLYFLICGDLSFFYDMNALGNRHVGKNIRIMVINNGRGTEFRQYNNPGALFGDETDLFIAAAGHYGQKSSNLIKHYAEDLGFLYLTASNKEEFLKISPLFVRAEMGDKPMILEIFTESKDESDALKIVRSIERDSVGVVKDFARSILGNKGVDFVKKKILK